MFANNVFNAHEDYRLNRLKVSVDDKSEGETMLDTNCLKKEAGAMISPKTEPATAAENSEETKDKDKEASRNEATNWKVGTSIAVIVNLMENCSYERNLIFLENATLNSSSEVFFPDG